MTVSDCMAKLAKPLVQVLVKDGFTKSGRTLHRQCGDVIHYFGWDLPAARAAGLIVGPSVSILSRALLDKTGMEEMKSCFESGQVSLSLGDDLPEGGWAIREDADIDRVIPDIVRAYYERGARFLDACRSSEALVELMARRPELTMKSKERVEWEVKVWRDEIDPAKEPFKPRKLGLSKTEFASVEEMLAAMREAEARDGRA